MSYKDILPQNVIDAMNIDNITDESIMSYIIGGKQIDLFLNYIVPLEINPEIIYDITWRLLRYKIGITNDQRKRLIEIRTIYLSKRDKQKKELNQKMSGIKREIRKGITNDRETNKKQKLENTCCIVIINNGKSFDNVILLNIFKYLSNYHQFFARRTCKGFYSVYLSTPIDYYLVTDNEKSRYYKHCILSMILCTKDKRNDIDISKIIYDVEQIRIMRQNILNYNYDENITNVLSKFLSQNRYQIYNFHGNYNENIENVYAYIVSNSIKYDIVLKLRPKLLIMNLKQCNGITGVFKSVKTLVFINDGYYLNAQHNSVYLFVDLLFKSHYINNQYPNVKNIIVTNKVQNDIRISEKHGSFITNFGIKYFAYKNFFYGDY